MSVTSSKIELDAVSLRRMGELCSVIRQHGDTDDVSQEMEEYGTLQEQVMPAVESAIRLLVRADLMTIAVNLTPEIVEAVSSGEYSTITLEPRRTFLNGNVWVEVYGETSGGMMKRPALGI